MKEIDLGREMSMPEQPAQTSDPEDKGEKSVSYPCLYVELNGTDLSELPESGTMTVKFKVGSRTESTDRDGEKHNSLSIDILKILDVDPDKPKKGKSREDELDDLAESEKNAKSGEEESYD
jgi:hypothetical protein